ncbi:MAG: EF-hand domain-containing protein [Verrucomicrobiota bacterium]|nr:EF-hand domain-containing protein [Verrucomicrobiota bacterium]
MLEEREPEKPFLLQHLIIHVILAIMLLVGGWLFPAQYKTLHRRVLQQAGLEKQKFEIFINSYTNAPDSEIKELLRISREKIDPEEKREGGIDGLTSPVALDEYINAPNRFWAKSRLGRQGAACKELLKLEEVEPSYTTTIILTAQLQADGKIAPELHESIIASRHYTGQLPQILHAILILGNRLSKVQLAELISGVPDQGTLIKLAKIAKHQTMLPAFHMFDTDGKTPDALTIEELKGYSAIGEKELFTLYDEDKNGALSREEWVQIGHIPLQYTDFPATYAACIWSGNPKAVAKYLMRYGRRGDDYLRTALNQGEGALALVLDRQQPVSSLNTPALGTVASFCHNNPIAALAVKYLMICLGCVVLMRTWNSFFTLSATSLALLKGYRMRRRAMVLALFLSLIAVSEPILLTPALSSEYEVAINLPQASVDLTEPQPNTNTMLANASSNTLSIIFIVIFAAIQGFVYYTCITKINEVKNGAGDPKLKLRLLENEDNLFDMGLYIGIAGTALMLAILIMFPKSGISVSAAYASNIFGILCVAVVKIFHVRQTREALIIEGETRAGGEDLDRTI